MEFMSNKARVIHWAVNNGQLELTLDWFGKETSRSVISKTASGYLYENVGLMWRKCLRVDEILEELDSSTSLNKMIEDLPVMDVDEDLIPFTSDNRIENYS